jgi:hypothetical protein
LFNVFLLAPVPGRRSPEIRGFSTDFIGIHRSKLNSETDFLGAA